MAEDRAWVLEGQPASWTAPAERSGDGAFAQTVALVNSNRVARAKAAWRYASRRSPRHVRFIRALANCVVVPAFSSSSSSSVSSSVFNREPANQRGREGGRERERSRRDRVDKPPSFFDNASPGMIFLPIVGRELRVASRRRRAYTLRAGSVAFGAILTGAASSISPAHPSPQARRTRPRPCSGRWPGLAMLYCLVIAGRLVPPPIP